MKKTNIRSKYIRNLAEEAAGLGDSIEAATKDAVSALLESTINESLRKLISEEKEEDDTLDNNDEEPIDNIVNNETTEDEQSEETETPTEEEPESTETVDIIDDEGEGDESGDNWDESFEQFKDEDDEYDLTAQDDETVARVLMAMDPEKDGIRVVKNDNGTLTLTDDNTEKEYIIDLDCEGGCCDVDNEESEFEIEINEDLGYTDNYQNVTAMTTPDNHEPSKFGRTWDKGVPQGTQKPWVGDGAKKKGHPYDDNVNEEFDECGDNCIYEIEIPECDLEEASREQAGQATHRGITATKAREGSATGAIETGYNEGDRNDDRNMYENMKRKASAILAENKELKGFAKKISDKLNESVVINASLSKVLKLMTENSTTREEKLDIINRFNSVRTLDECKRLYNTISEELQKAHGINSGSPIKTDVSLTESASHGKAQETQLLESKDVKETIDFMKRLDKIK